MRTIIVFIALAGMLVLGGDVRALTNCFTLIGEAGGRADACSVQAPIQLLASRPTPPGEAIPARSWNWKTIFIAAPAACGMVVLLARLSLLALRWCWRRLRAGTDSSQGEVDTNDNVPAPYIASLVEREHRRAIERAEARQGRRGAIVARDKDDLSRAA